MARQNALELSQFVLLMKRVPTYWCLNRFADILPAFFRRIDYLLPTLNSAGRSVKIKRVRHFRSRARWSRLAQRNVIQAHRVSSESRKGRRGEMRDGEKGSRGTHGALALLQCSFLLLHARVGLTLISEDGAMRGKKDVRHPTPSEHVYLGMYHGGARQGRRIVRRNMPASSTYAAHARRYPMGQGRQPRVN